MLSQVLSASTYGIEAFVVKVETHIETGLFAFAIVGLPDSSVKESRERVNAAIKNSGFKFPNKKITVNLAPADIKKEGSQFDLPIAIGILSATDQIRSDVLDKFIILGELALDGTLRPIHGALPIAMSARNNGLKGIILPKENAKEAAIVSDIEVYPMSSLTEVVNFLNSDIKF